MERSFRFTRSRRLQIWLNRLLLAMRGEIALQRKNRPLHEIAGKQRDEHADGEADRKTYSEVSHWPRGESAGPESVEKMIPTPEDHLVHEVKAIAEFAQEHQRRVRKHFGLFLIKAEGQAHEPKEQD